MMSYIKKVHGKPGLHVSINLLFGVWPPCCATPLPPSSWVRAHKKYCWPREHEKINSWVSFISLYGSGAPLGGPLGHRSSAMMTSLISPLTPSSHFTTKRNHQIMRFKFCLLFILCISPFFLSKCTVYFPL